LAGLGSSFSNWSGGCVHVEVAVSSGDGYRPELSDRQSLFVAGTSTPTPLDRSALPQAAVVIPGALDTVEIIYDLPGISTPLRLSGSVLAGIYLGTISSWSDPRITSLNPGVDLSGAPPITPVYRDDAAPVNQAVTTFLAAANSSWASSIGSGPAVAWPAGVAASGPAAMASEVAAEPGAVGYLESVLSTPVGVQVASLQSAEGAFVLPTPTNATSAAAALASSPPFTSQDWANASVVDAPGTGSYPLVELAYTTMYKDPGTAYGGNLSRTNATWLLSFLWWMVTNASTVAPALGLAPLPEALVVLAQQDLENVTYDGSPVLEAEEPGGGETGEF
jgi:ABC-type phosphate transport system substrate-binding protein